MCNLYGLTKSQDEIRRAFRIDADRTGNLPPLPGIFPNTAAPIVHEVAGLTRYWCGRSRRKHLAIKR